MYLMAHIQKGKPCICKCSKRQWELRGKQSELPANRTAASFSVKRRRSSPFATQVVFLHFMRSEWNGSYQIATSKLFSAIAIPLLPRLPYLFPFSQSTLSCLADQLAVVSPTEHDEDDDRMRSFRNIASFYVVGPALMCRPPLLFLPWCFVCMGYAQCNSRTQQR